MFYDPTFPSHTTGILCASQGELQQWELAARQKDADEAALRRRLPPSPFPPLTP